MRLLLVLLLAGCAAVIPWTRPGASSQDYFMDEGQCEAQSRPSRKQGVDFASFDACMRAKGWQKRS